MEEEISRTGEYINTQGEAFDFVVKYKNDEDNKSLYDIGTLPQRLTASVNLQSIPRKLSHADTEFQYLTQTKTLKSKGSH